MRTMAQRLIDADKLLKEIRETYEYEFPTASGAFDEFVTMILPSIIKNAPTVDAVPVVHGFLKEVPYKRFDPPDAPYGNEVDEETGWTFEWDTKTVCSVCGYEPKSFKPNYCENCGAKMSSDSDG